MSSSSISGVIRNPRSRRSRSTSIDESALKQEATAHIRDYKAIKILEQLVDHQKVVVEETLLVARASNPAMRYALRIVELRDEDALRAIFHEIHILKKLQLHQQVMGLFAAFRHRQYIALLQPPFITLRDKIDLLHRFRKSGGQLPVLFRDPSLEKKWNEDTSELRGQQFLAQIGVFGRDAVVFVLRQLLSGLEYLNSMAFVHTQICASSVFVDERCSSVKLGSFLHVRRLHSPRWSFTGNASRLPPEAFHNSAQNRVRPNFDTWAIGLFVLEMITGKRLHYTREEMKELAQQFIDGTQAPPTLAETDPTTIKDGHQLYDRDIDSFLATCFIVHPTKRPNPSELLGHNFMARPTNDNKGRINIGVQPMNSAQWNVKRSLRLEMLSVHTYCGQLKEGDLVAQILNAIRLVQDSTCVPIFGEPLTLTDLRDYVAVDASLSFLNNDDDQDWSRDVLNESSASPMGGELRNRKGQEHKTPRKTGEQIGGQSGKFMQEQKDYQRCEMLFFVRRKWSKENRQLFIALQFARWLNRKLISFADLVRIVDELDDILIDHISTNSEPRPFSPYKPSLTRTTSPDSVAFISGLRRSLLDPEASQDPQTHRFNNVYLEVALSGKMLKKKLNKFNRLREGDPVEHPDSLGPLSASATFYNLNMQRLDLMEAVLMGERRVREWDFDPQQRFADAADPRTQLTTLLKERRRDPNAKVDSDIDWGASNEARRAKIWGDHTRDFMYRFARYYVPQQLSEEAAAKVYGARRLSSTSEESAVEPLNGTAGDESLTDLQISLLRTRSKQEQHRVAPSKCHDDVEMRREAVRRMEQRRMDDQIRRMSAQLELLRGGSSQHSKYDSPATVEGRT